jgi:excinuclease UvrABC ATPase subunit
MTMTVQQERKKRRKRNTLTPEKENALAKEFSKVLGVDVKVKRPSKALNEALEALALDFDKLQSKVDKVFEIGRAEGYPDKEIGSMIREKMRDQYHRNTITNVFAKYPEAKSKTIPKKVTNNVTSDGKCPKCGKPLNEPVQSNTKDNEAISVTDKNRFYKETIEAKSKLIAELREEIADKDKKIIELGRELVEMKK